MAKHARPTSGKRKQVDVAEQNRLRKIAETARAVKQERRLVALARQLTRLIQTTTRTRRELAAFLANDCGCYLAERVPATDAAEPR